MSCDEKKCGGLVTNKEVEGVVIITKLQKMVHIVILYTNIHCVQFLVGGRVVVVVEA